MAPDPIAYWNTAHCSRSFGGPGHLERDCPCPKEACGCIRHDRADPDCNQHGPGGMNQTVRHSHAHENCPDRPEPDLIAAIGSSCDWGNCGYDSIALAWSTPAGTWLPVCTTCLDQVTSFAIRTFLPTPADLAG